MIKITASLLGVFCSLCAYSQNTAIIAHRGFWNCQEGGYSENSIASLKSAQRHGFWGSEFDVHITADNVLIVTHDHDVEGLPIATTQWKELKKHLLPNLERRPTLEKYLRQGKKHPETMLVLEFKKQASQEREDAMVDKAFALLKKYQMFRPDRVLFISFSRHICERIAREAPEFCNQYLNGDLTPAQLKELGINGMDYSRKVLASHPEYISQAKELGLSTNVWTVNKKEEAEYFISLGIGAITTNDPLMVQALCN